MPVDAKRIQRIREAMTEHHWDGLICRLPENVLFLSGWWPLSGTTWIVVSREGQSCLIIPACETAEAEADGITDFAAYEWAHLKAPDVGEQVRDSIKSICTRFGIAKGKIGIEENFEGIAPPLNLGEPSVPVRASRELVMQALPGAKLEDATEFINSLRLCKTPAEVEKFRIANEIAGFGLAWFRENLRVGMTEIELAAQVNSEIAIRGSGYKGMRSARAFAQVSSGAGTERGWRPFEITTNRPFAKGDIVLLELGVVADGYWADNTRVLVAGGANQKQREVYNVVLTAQLAAIERIRVGVKMSEVDQAARKIIEGAGYGEYFIHVTGHGVGWRYHEFPPLLHPSNEQLLREGMITSVEPGIYIPGFGGMRVEDNVAVGPKGADVLSTVSKEMN